MKLRIPDISIIALCLLSTIVMAIIGTFTVPPANEETLKSFYRQVRPLGFWKPIKELVEKDNQKFKSKKDFGRDMPNVIPGNAIQTSLAALPVYVVLMKKNWILLFSVLLIVLGSNMKKTWWYKLENVNN